LSRHFVYPLTARRCPAQAGSKAANIHFLLRHHQQVPASWVVVWSARDSYLQAGEAVILSLRMELLPIINPEKRYAVRSSATVEDTGEFSCAGLFRSDLQVQGLDSVLTSIKSVWASLESPEYEAYRRNTMSAGTVAHMAVIIQEMVDARLSGVAFSKNPLTGLSETIIEAGRGTGDAQVENRLSPERWISKWGSWMQKPPASLLSETLADNIAARIKEIARQYRRPADLEWAWDGDKLYILQIRPITRLNIPIYSNRIAREMLPGVIKPLVWSVNTRLINMTWVRLLTQLTGERSWNPDDLTGHFYYRAYINMAIFARVFERLGMPGEALELLFGLEQDGPDKPHMKPGPGFFARLPQLLAFILGFIGINRRMQHFIREKKPALEALSVRMEGEHAVSEWLQFAQQLFDEIRDIAYYNIMIPMLAMMYHRLLISQLKKQGYDARLLELRGAQDAAAQYNPQHAIQELHDLYFSDITSAEPASNALPPEREASFRRDLDRFLQRYGHFSDSGNDCSSIPWRESPDLIRRMIACPQQIDKGSAVPMQFGDLRLKGMNKHLIRLVYHNASRFAISREAISSLYTYGYGQFRTCFVHLGEHLARQGVLAGREDIFYLYWPEMADSIADPHAANLQDLVRSRQEAINSYRGANLPETIFGNTQPPVTQTTPDALRGIPTSLGTYAGPARVIYGLSDFAKMQDGDVLVIPFSDVGWIPLFTKAGAVVAESGGMLSHSSIIAREYRIPAVVSVVGACRLADGAMISVNGYTGDVVLL
jgi:phosphohistidine swiveling domain-containing protein